MACEDANSKLAVTVADVDDENCFDGSCIPGVNKKPKNSKLSGMEFGEF